MEKTMMETSKPRKQKSGFLHNLYVFKAPYLMILPALLCVTIFNYMPMYGIVMAFKDFNIMHGIWGSPWVGLDNFRQIFSSPALFGAIKNTLVYGLVIMFGGFPFPIILALMFNEVRSKWFKKTAQTIAYFPHFLSWISVIGLCYSFLAKEGPVNHFLGQMIEGYTPVNPLMKSENFLTIMFVTHLWKNIGYSSVVFLAAITGVDPGLYEAASIDGCGKWKQAWYITLPSIKPTVVIVLVMSLGGLISVNFEQVYGLQNAFTQLDTEVIGTVVYREGLQNGKYSMATAFGLFQGAVSLFLVLTSNFISKKVTQQSIW